MGLINVQYSFSFGFPLKYFALKHFLACIESFVSDITATGLKDLFSKVR
jgi:hypothetical protein